MIKGTKRGMFFCAVVGAETEFERTYLRFIPAFGAGSNQVDTKAHRFPGS